MTIILQGSGWHLVAVQRVGWRILASPNIFELLLASVNIMETSITESRLEIDKPDLIIRPPLGEIRFLEFGRAEEIISIGYDSAREQLKLLR